MTHDSAYGGRTGKLSGCRVLIVEDEYLLASDLEELLQAQGATVVGPIADISEAEDQIAHGGFDAAVIDLNLRGQFTYSLADELMRRRIPMVFATGYGANVMPARFHDVKRWEKPFNMSVISKDVSVLCNQRAPV